MHPNSQMPLEQVDVIHRSESVLASNKVLRNTYMLLSMTLLFSAGVAGTAMTLNLPHPGMIITLVGYFGLLFATSHFRNSSLGLVLVFALTGFMGYTLGPILNAYLALPNGGQLVMTAMGMTGFVFVGMSAIALTTKKDFGFMGKTLMIGALVGFAASLIGIFFSIPLLGLVASSMFVFIASGLILWQTSEIIHGGETNYIMATVTLFVSIFNLLLNLLHILGFLSGDD